MTLHGIDVSHWNSGLTIAHTDAQFMICKATDGGSYVDPTCNSFVSQAKNAHIPWGTYHFYQGSPQTEADHYVKSISNYVGKGLMVLDFETHTSDVKGAKAWLDRVHQVTGIRPLIYMSQSVANGHNWSSVAPDYGLWVARYNDEIGPTGAWKNVAMWQYTDRHHTAGMYVDGDRFYGNTDTWTAYVTGHPINTKPDTGGTTVDYWHPDPSDPHYHQTQGDPIEEAKLNLKEAHANAVAKPNDAKATALNRILQEIRSDPDIPWWDQ